MAPNMDKYNLLDWWKQHKTRHGSLQATHLQLCGQVRVLEKFTHLTEF